eukprot:CAMPEP_0204614834 /NCGR_PEP_ID=MMETSP0717-20131115/2469_1 /ASSEMBLY_ACC=CAM_ASM_000666 /TAXON_ID=230516 /ORGANISM="Chaetoceros curvisetus" /LENGTH=192 /DNA_ID=CAMNT_0051627609 /DNA_START=29 /DNA_END=607 /DNA_ORIENTATION=-
MTSISQSFSKDSVGSECSAVTRMTIRQMRECEDIFSVFENEDDSVDVKHLPPMLNALLMGNKPSDEEIARMARKVRGKMNFTYFIQLVAPYMEAAYQDYSQDKIEDAFARFDKDGNGFISASELRTLLSEAFGDEMKEVADKLTDDDVLEVMAEADLDGDGKINYAEFQEMVPHLGEIIQKPDGFMKNLGVE